MSFEKIKKNFGFGCMRLPIIDGKVNYSEFNRMIDMFIAAGFNYFDTAHGYIDGMSETAIRECLASRYDREDYVLANKLSSWLFKDSRDIIPLFERQLELCGVDYFDFYILHSMNKENYQKHLSCNSFEIVKKLKDEGKIRHIAISFHDTADVLDTILAQQPSIEAVQLQINYLDYDDPNVQSKACYDVAVKYGKKVIVMEPVKGGALVNLPDKAAELLSGRTTGSQASFALRYAASFENVFMVLSGMGNTDMMADNIKTMSDFVPLSDSEFELADRLRGIIREVKQIPCTKCNYCADVCPKKIPVSDIFSVYNGYLAAKLSKAEVKGNLPDKGAGAGDCIKCSRCEEVCPQNISIRKHLEKVAEKFK